jgi:hypothetical protein
MSAVIPYEEKSMARLSEAKPKNLIGFNAMLPLRFAQGQHDGLESLFAKLKVIYNFADHEELL